MARKQSRAAQDTTLVNNRATRKAHKSLRLDVEKLKKLVKSHGIRLNEIDAKLEIE